MRLSDLQNKDIISVADGRKIGNIIDVKIEEKTGQITSLLIEPNRFFLKFFSLREEFEIYWSDIEKIGEDVILIRVNL
ncbi:MAG: YlmC/YmxH family sporulation protein [Bacilli bacterium]|jgi:YlmC/YmxH family sporulation protein